MREIKFRGNWKYGYLTIIEKAHESNMIAIKPFDEEWITYGVYAESVGEYTGLKDKNGKEIYEGDIVELNKVGRYEVDGGRLSAASVYGKGEMKLLLT